MSASALKHGWLVRIFLSRWAGAFMVPIAAVSFVTGIRRHDSLDLVCGSVYGLIALLWFVIDPKKLSPK